MARRTLGDVARETVDAIINDLWRNRDLNKAWFAMTEDERRETRERWENLVLHQGAVEE